MIYFESGVNGDYGPNYPRVGYNSATARGTLAANTEATGFEAVNAASPFEYNYWKPTGTATDYLELTLGSAETINGVFITAHTLGTTGATVQVKTGGAAIGPSVSPTNDRPIGILLNDRSLTTIRVEVSGASSAPLIGVLYFCEVLEFPQLVYVDQRTPYNLANNTEYRNNRTIGGKYVGRSIKRQRERVEAPIKHVRETWIETYMTDFIEDARTNPYFLLPRPGDYPKDIGYKWAEQDIQPARMGVGGNMMEFNL